MRTTIVALSLATAAFAQGPTAQPLIQAYMPRYNAMKQNLVEAAEAMPADAYGFKLSANQRAFGEWVDHTILLLHTSCSTISGMPPPEMDHSKHGGDKSKAVLVTALKESADVCDKVLKNFTDQSALTRVDVGGKPTYPVDAMMGLLTNMASHYGNMVGYLRAKNITPPSTARTQKKK
jgi:hypothetical protein